jgi:hypothetical protein
LEDAKQALEGQDIPVEIKSGFDVENDVNTDPSVSFVCIGPERKNRHGGRSEPKSRSAMFSSDGLRIFIELGTQVISNSFKEERFSAEAGKAEAMIARAVQGVLDSYFVSVDELRNSGIW